MQACLQLKMNITFRGKEKKKPLKICRRGFSLPRLQLRPGTGELVENLISLDGLLSVQSTISQQSSAAGRVHRHRAGWDRRRRQGWPRWGTFPLLVLWLAPRGRAGSVWVLAEHHQATHPWQGPPGLPLLEEPAMLPANHTATRQHPLLQAAFVLVFLIPEGVSHVYYLFQLFLPYKSNKKKRSTMLLHPICFLKVEVVPSVAFLAHNDWRRAEQLRDR